MKKWLKRVRGAFGMGLTWAVAHFGVGAVAADDKELVEASEKVAGVDLSDDEARKLRAGGT